MKKELLNIWRPFLGRVKNSIRAHNNGYCSVSDNELVSDMWETAKAAGWTLEEITANPSHSVSDVLAIWG